MVCPRKAAARREIDHSLRALFLAITKWFKPQTFDDPIDRLNYFITATLLTFFALMVSAKQYVGSPIQCFCPMEFKGGWEQYAE
jgi:innexin